MKDRREVLVSVAAGAHNSEDLVSEGAQRDGRLCVGGSVLSQAKILETEAQPHRHQSVLYVGQRAFLSFLLKKYPNGRMQNTCGEGMNSYPDGPNNTGTKNDPVNAVTVNLSVKHRWDLQEEDIKKTKEQLK